MRHCYLMVMLAVVGSNLAQAEEEKLPAGEVRELLCRMAVGNIQEHAQDKFNLYAELYADVEATYHLGAYGLLTGLYYGPGGVSHFGPTMDDPIAPRYFEDGTQAHDYMAAELRASTAEFRRTKCEGAE
jgi:hypothetical protein